MQFVFAKDYLTEMNKTIAFRAALLKGKYHLRMAGANVFRIFVNDVFLGYGPMRTAHGYANVYETDFALTADGFITVEVAAYNVNGYYTIFQPPFFGAEISDCSGKAVCKTEDFKGYLIPDRIQKINRYSMMRTFAESYRMSQDRTAFYRGEDCYPEAELCAVSGCELLESGLHVPKYGRVVPAAEVGQTRVTVERPAAYEDHVFFYKSKEWQTRGFGKEELEENLLFEVQDLRFGESGEGRCTEYAFDHNTTGFLSLHVSAKKPSTVWLLFDELHPIVPWRAMCVLNAIKYELGAGEFDLLAFEPYTMKYCKVVVFGDAVASQPSLISYENPDGLCFAPLPDADADKIFRAARETLLQNAVDVLTDCPSRERGGYLCDSYFTAKAEHLFTGDNRAEENLLRAFLLAPDPVPNIPRGMLPMCYPGDHFDRRYIANWALWLVVQLRDRLTRTGKRGLIDGLREKVYGLFSFLRGFENEYGLLEHVGGWVFVEWSRANDFVQDVNYPSNMLYAGALQAAGELYGDGALLQKADRVREEVRRESFNGKFFADNAVREYGALRVTGHTTETCQYYAFYFGVATKERYPALYDTMFCSDRKDLQAKGLYPSNAFIGNVLRLDFLAREREYARLLQEVKDCYLYMAETTGTLWEHVDTSASCNHGFSSVAGVWLWEIFHNDTDKENL